MMPIASSARPASMSETGVGSRGPVTDGARCVLSGLGTLVRYSFAWPIFLHREALAAYDEGLAFWLAFILGDKWKDGGLDEARPSRRRAR
jgi:hypothetical protein